MKSMFNIDGLPGITMQGIQGSEGERGCTTVLGSVTANESEIRIKQYFVYIIDDDEDGYVYVRTENEEVKFNILTPSAYLSATGVTKISNDTCQYGVYKGFPPIIGDYIITQVEQSTEIYQATEIIHVKDISEYSEVTKDNVNEISSYNAYANVINNIADIPSENYICVIVKRVDKWLFNPSNEDINIDMSVAINTEVMHYDQYWKGGYEKSYAYPTAHLSFYDVTDEERKNTSMTKIKHDILRYKSWIESNLMTISFKDIDTLAVIPNLHVYLYATENNIETEDDIPTEPIADGYTDTNGDVTFTLSPASPENIYKLLYISTESTDTQDVDMDKRFKAIYIQLRNDSIAGDTPESNIYMYSSADINNMDDRTLTVATPVFNTAICADEKSSYKKDYYFSTFTVTSSMNDEDKKKIRIIAEFTLINDGIYHFDSVLVDKVEKSRPYNDADAEIKWNGESIASTYEIGAEKINHPVRENYNIGESGFGIIPNGRTVKYKGGDMGYEYELFDYADPYCGYASSYPTDGSFSFDSESPRRFNVVVKDFDEGNEGSSYTASKIIPKDVVDKYNVSIYLIVNTGMSGLQRVHLGTAKMKSTGNINNETEKE